MQIKKPKHWLLW